MLTTTFRCLFVATLALVASPALAWNALGHKTVAEIAWRRLTPEKRQEIVDTLRRHPRFDDDFVKKMPKEVDGANKATQDHWIFQQAAYWPDVARGGPFDHPTWHYINGPIFVDRSDRRALAGRLTNNISDQYPTSVEQSRWNILQAIKHCQAVLRDKNTPPAERAIAYCWLFHLVGDGHQPLHSCALFSASRFPKGDRGGNSIPLLQGDNLHALWDNLLGRRNNLPDVQRVYAELSSEKYADVWAMAGDVKSPRRWMAESFDLAKDFAYDKAILDVVRRATPQQPLEKITLSEAYLKEAGYQARRRVVAAGVRLGDLLDDGEARKRTDRTTAAPAIGPLPIPVASLVSPAASQPQAELTHWLNTQTDQRHNSGCRWYGKTTEGRYCGADEGDLCRQCGG